MRRLSRRALVGGAIGAGGHGLVGGAGVRPAAATDLLDAPCDEGAAPAAGEVSSLAALAARQGRSFGCAVKDPLFTDAPFRQLVIAQCNHLVCVYSMKWRHLEVAPGHYDFTLADRYVDFAERHGMPIRGHTLIWDHETPPWLEDALSSGGLAAMERHVRMVAGHYAGRLHSWDVVNEAVWPADARADRLRANPFLAALGPSYVDAAFAAAREADPRALLYYNANPAPYGRENDRAHFEGVVALLEGLIGRGVPVQGLGLQGHLAAALADQFDEAVLAWFLEQVSALRLEIMITELDVTDKGLPADPAERDRRVAASYRRFLDVALAFPAVKGVLTWGIGDRYSELDHWPRDDGWAVRGLPFDRCLQPKPAHRAIAEAFLAHDPA